MCVCVCVCEGLVGIGESIGQGTGLCRMQKVSLREKR